MDRIMPAAARHRLAVFGRGIRRPARGREPAHNDGCVPCPAPLRPECFDEPYRPPAARRPVRRARARGAGAAAGAPRLRHRLARAGRARRLLSGGRRRHLPEARPRRDDPHGRPAGQRPAAPRRRAARRRDGRRAAGALRGRAERPDHGDRRDVPEESDRAHRAPRRGEDRGPQGQADRDRRGGQHDVLAVAEAALRIHRRPEAAVRVQRPAVPRRPEPVAAGLRDVRAVLDREGRRQAGRVPARRSAAIRRTPRRWSSRATRSPSAPTRWPASSARPPKAGRAISPIRRPATRSSSATIRRWPTSSSPTAIAR